MNKSIVPDSFKAVRSDFIDKQIVSKLVRISLNEVSDGEILIRNRFAGVNYKDCLAITGKAKVIANFPRIAGIEFVGDVVQSSSDKFSVGQAVLVHGFQTGINFDGAFAEYVRTPAAHVMPLPDGLSAWQAAAIGVPGFTTALALDRFQQLGIEPDSGTIAVSGATGAVGMFALMILSRAGYEVCALTRRPGERSALHALGASDIIDSTQFAANTKLLNKANFSAAIDNVSGATLSWLLRSIKDGGALASVGNASGNNVETNVLPFILRSITMFGINANASWPTRERLWHKLATDWLPDFSQLEPHLHTIKLDELLEYSERHLDGKTSGRTLICF